MRWLSVSCAAALLIPALCMAQTQRQRDDYVKFSPAATIVVSSDVNPLNNHLEETVGLRPAVRPPA